VKLRSGKIDLNPRGDFEVTAGATLSIRIDIDADKSIKLHQAGQSGKCIFRPVVFVDIMVGAPPRRCPRSIRAEIAEVVEDAGDNTVGFLIDSDGRVEVRLDDDTVIFDESGNPGGPEDLEVGKNVLVRGRLDEEGGLLATVVVIGDVFHIDGVVETAVEEGSFQFQPASGEAIVGEVSVEVTDGTFVLVGCDDRVDADAIGPGLEAVVVGKFDADEDTLRAVTVFLSSA